MKDSPSLPDLHPSEDMMFLWEITFEDKYGLFVQWYWANTLEEALSKFREFHNEGVVLLINSIVKQPPGAG
jgi:hypothetical protein